MASTRIEATFARLAEEKKGGLVTYFMAGDPDYDTSLEILKQLPEAGADVIELGMAFTDPMADGPEIQEAGNRALAGGATLAKTLDLVAEFRKTNDTTPIVIMGYYNPIYFMGVDSFLKRALDVGVDGLIVVDLPPEEDDELCIPAIKAGIDFIRLATPTTDEKRLPTVLQNTGGFVYYVSVAGITGAARGAKTAVGDAVARIKASRDLPVVVGFGIKTPEDVREVSSIADAAVVGTALVKTMKESLDADGKATDRTVSSAVEFVRSLASGKADR